MTVPQFGTLVLDGVIAAKRKARAGMETGGGDERREKGIVKGESYDLC
jgi:hypothetical protein